MTLDTTMPRPDRSPEGDGPSILRKAKEPSEESERLVHVMRDGVVCDTERRGHPTPQGRSPTRIVVDASEGFVPLWAPETILRWRFRERSLKAFEDSAATEAAIEQLLAEALLAWGDAAPVRFTKDNDVWDFEIVVRQGPDATEEPFAVDDFSVVWKVRCGRQTRQPSGDDEFAEFDVMQKLYPMTEEVYGQIVT